MDLAVISVTSIHLPSVVVLSTLRAWSSWDATLASMRFPFVLMMMPPNIDLLDALAQDDVRVQIGFGFFP